MCSLRLEAHPRLCSARTSLASVAVEARSTCSCPTSTLQPSSSTGLGAARQTLGCHCTSIWGQRPSHVSARSGQRWFGRQAASEHPSVCKKAQHRAVKLPQTALNIFPCLQPLRKSLWQERYTLYHTNLFTPSPPSLSWAGFSARSLLVGLPEFWLVARPQLGLCRTAMEKSSLTSWHSSQ